MQPTLDELWPQYRDAAPEAKRLLELIAVSEGGWFASSQLSSAYGLGGVERLAPSTARTLLTQMVRSGALLSRGRYGMHPVFAERIVRHVISEDRYERLSSAIEQVAPLSDAYGMQRTSMLREARRAWVRGDDGRALTLLRMFSDLFEAPPIHVWMLDPVPAERLRHTQPDLVAYLLSRAQRTGHTRGVLDPAIRGLIEELGTRHTDHPVLTMLHARELVLVGALDEALRVIGNPTHESAYAVSAWVYLIKGDVKRSCTLYAKALAAHRKEHGGRRSALTDISGPFQPLAYAASESTSRISQGHRLVRDTLKSVMRDWPMWGGYHALHRMFRHDSDGHLAMAPPSGPHPVAALQQALTARWLEEEIDDDNVKAAIIAADREGWRWLAAELRVVQSGSLRQALPGTVPLLSLRRATPRWLGRLEALEQAIGIKEEGPRLGMRIAWRVFPPPMTYLEARHQKATKRGSWTAGKTIPDKVVFDGLKDVEGATDRDRRVASCLTRQRSQSWRSSAKEYRWDQQVWAEIAGHDTLVGFHAPEQAVTVRVVSPTLRVRADGDDLILELTPDPTEGFTVFESSPFTYDVVRFDDQQRALGKHLRGGLRLPANQADRIAAMLPGLANQVQVHDESNTFNGESVDPISAVILQLVPSVDGVHVRAIVRPLGPQGPSFPPSDGPTTILCRVDDNVLHTQRDLEAERVALNRLERRIPVLLHAAIDGNYDLPDVHSTLELLDQVARAGDVQVEWPQGQPLRLRQAVDHASVSVSVQSDGQWFDVQGSVAIDEGLVLSISELLGLMHTTHGRFVQLDDGQWLALSTSLHRQLDDLSRVSEAHGHTQRVHRLATGLTKELVQSAGDRTTDAAWREQLERLESEHEAMVPTTLQASLRPYQLDGYFWMARMAHIGAGACLADDMGLGKTVQSLALLLHRCGRGPALVVAPTSVAGNWLAEAWRFAPTLNAQRYGSGDRSQFLQNLGPGDLVVCSYGLLQSDIERIEQVRWSTVILDEAQAIKNPHTLRHKAVLRLKAEARIATTGTPIENHLGELHALFQFLNPGLLSTASTFQRRFAAPIADKRRDVQNQLRRLILPFILRRTKATVLQDLPTRTEVTLSIEPSAEEAAYLEALRRKAVADLDGPSKVGPMQILAHLTRLRLASCHPSLVSEVGAPQSSAKLREFARIVQDLREGGHRALVFSQFVKHLALLRAHLDAKHIPYLYLDGSTPAKQRDARVRRFQQGEGVVFLISLKAGGSGLNLTGADYVIHMDPWWNPAVEDQASDRAHRIGQTRPVTIYRMVLKGSIEERIVALHRKKRDLADRLLHEADGATQLSTRDLLDVLRSE